MANSSAYSYFRVLLLLDLISVFFRVIPWQMLLLGFVSFLISVANLMLNSVAHASGSERQL